MRCTNSVLNNSVKKVLSLYFHFIDMKARARGNGAYSQWQVQGANGQSRLRVCTPDHRAFASQGPLVASERLVGTPALPGLLAFPPPPLTTIAWRAQCQEPMVSPSLLASLLPECILSCTVRLVFLMALLSSLSALCQRPQRATRHWHRRAPEREDARGRRVLGACTLL